MDLLSKDDFLKLIDEGQNVFDHFSDPVRIGDGASNDMICMSVDQYDKLNNDLDSAADSDIRYYILELSMPVEIRDQLEDLARKLEMTMDELFAASIKNFINYVNECKAKNVPLEHLFPEESSDSDEIKVIRCFPVHRGETQAQARKNALQSEHE
jgi:hypothetical protein